jgi:predicted double-glycine peptidase
MLYLASAGINSSNEETHSKRSEILFTNTEKSCGPSCLLAIIRITGMGSNKYNSVEDIYDLIGKKANTPTTLYDLKIAAKKLGFNAEGYACTVDNLTNINGYAILTVGHSKGTVTDPLHMILLREIRNDTAIIIDPNTLQDNYVTISKLKKAWNGYALIVSSKKDTPLFRTISNENKPVIQEKRKGPDEIKNFGNVDGGSLLEHSFPIRNETDNVITLRIVGKNCSCVSAELGQTKLPPNQESFIKLSLFVDEPGETIAAVAVDIQPVNVIKSYVIKAQGRDSFQTIPAIGYIEAPEGGVVEYPVTATYFTDLNDIVTLDRIDVNLPNLTIKNKKIEKILTKQYSVYNVNTTLFYDCSEPINSVLKVEGKLNLVLNTTRGKRFIPFKMSVKIGKEKYRLIPEKVFLMPSKSNDSIIQKNVKLEILTEQAPSNITVKTDDSLPLEIKTTRESENTFLVSISPEKEKLQNISLGMHKSELVIIPEGLSEQNPIKMPISMFVRE